MNSLEKIRTVFPDFDHLPAEVEQAVADGLLKCIPWENDMCPCFSRTDYTLEDIPSQTALFVDWLDESKRGRTWRDPSVDHVPARFTVINVDLVGGDGTMYHGDDIARALTITLAKTKELP